MQTICQWSAFPAADSHPTQNRRQSKKQSRFSHHTVTHRSTHTNHVVFKQIKTKRLVEFWQCSQLAQQTQGFTAETKAYKKCCQERFLHVHGTIFQHVFLGFVYISMSYELLWVASPTTAAAVMLPSLPVNSLWWWNLYTILPVFFSCCGIFSVHVPVANETSGFFCLIRKTKTLATIT